MTTWSRPRGSGLPFCFEFDLDASVTSVRSVCNGRYPADLREVHVGVPTPEQRCGRCWNLSGGALAAFDLLSCPFCGRAPGRMSRASDHSETREFHVVSCFCGGYSARAHQHGETAAQAAERWNTRHVDLSDIDDRTAGRLAELGAGDFEVEP
jgi:Lar family restriction alleviation protein